MSESIYQNRKMRARLAYLREMRGGHDETVRMSETGWLEVFPRCVKCGRWCASDDIWNDYEANRLPSPCEYSDV